MIHLNTLQPYILDFGIAKPSLQISETNTDAGSHGFKAPEITYKLGPHSDIYSLGATLIALTNLEEGDSHWSQPLERCSFSDDLKRILTKMIQENYLERYQTCDQVLEDLESLVKQSTSQPILDCQGM